MNWFNKIQLIKHIIKLNRLTTKGNNVSIIKTAAILGPDPSTEFDWRHQLEDSIEFGNFQRYVCDSQTIKVFSTKTNTKLAVSLVTNHTYLGTAGWSIFWTFDLNKEKEAKELFRVVSSIARETVEEFIKEEKPTVLLHSVLRQKFKKLQRDEVSRTNIPIINKIKIILNIVLYIFIS